MRDGSTADGHTSDDASGGCPDVNFELTTPA
jgi:hypothetical protein